MQAASRDDETQAELSAEDRIVVNLGGTAPPTPPPGGIADTGVTVLAQVSAHSQTKKDAPAPPPATWGAYQKKTEDNNGVLAMVDMLVADLDKEMTEAKTDEGNSQEEYEEFLANAKAKRAEDAKSIEEKKAAKADMSARLEKMDLELKSTTQEAFAMTQTLGDLHAECDWLLQNFDSRKAARAGEIESLKNAKAVLSGADFSLMQTEVKHLRGAF